MKNSNYGYLTNTIRLNILCLGTHYINKVMTLKKTKLFGFLFVAVKKRLS